MRDARPHPGVRGPGDRFLEAVLLLAVCAWMVRAHWERIDLPLQEQKIRLHEDVLANRAMDPQQYKLWIPSLGLQEVAEICDASMEDVFYGNTLLSLLFLVIAHHLWLRTLVGARTALVGGLLLGALAQVLFLTYYHHPQEFWGVGLYCVLLLGVQRDWNWSVLAVLALLTGLVWEKHALVPVLWGLLALGRRRPLLGSLCRGLLMLAAALAVPLLVRWHLGADRALVDGDTYLDVQEWDKVLWFQLPYVVPFLLVFLLRFRSMPAWVRCLWLYLPVLALAYVAEHYILHEVRSFWPLAPVFTATACCWLAAPRPGSLGEQAAAPS